MRTALLAILMTSLVLGANAARAEPGQASAPSRPTYSADSLYNLANSYARAGKPGLAVLNYERAALLAPGDSDINANLELVRASAHVAAQPRSRLARIVEVASPSMAAWIGVLGVALVGGGLIARKMAPRLRRATAGVQRLAVSLIVIGAAMIALTASSAALLWPLAHSAVVLVDGTPARVAPAPMGDSAFVLREADTVTISAEHEDFVLIRNREGLAGWVARANLGIVVPRGNGGQGGIEPPTRGFSTWLYGYP